jgi:hypothetical protein
MLVVVMIFLKLSDLFSHDSLGMGVLGKDEEVTVVE